MSKVLEAWQRIKEFDSGGEFVSLYDFLDKEVAIIEKALTPPTAQDVCQALGDGFTYNANKKWFRNKGLPLIFKQKDGTIKTLIDLTPKQMGVVSRFYEEEVK